MAHIIGLQFLFLPRLAILVDADTGEHPRQFLHIVLAVATVHAQGVQLHQFAGIVFVEMTGGVLLVVQIAQHGRVGGHRPQQIAEMPQGMGANGVLFVIAQHGAQIALALVHAEVVHPEPVHLFLHLVRGIQGAQQVAGGGLALQAVEFLLIGLTGDLLVLVERNRIGVTAPLLQLLHQLDQRCFADRHGVDLALLFVWQRQRVRVQLRLQKLWPTLLLELGHGAAAGTPAQAVEQRVGVAG